MSNGDAPVYTPWTPAISYDDMSGETYVPNGQIGHCVKVGRLVTASFDLSLSQKGTGIASSPISILGLPHPARGVGFGTVRWLGMRTPVVWMGVMTNAGSTALLLFQTASPQTDSAQTLMNDLADDTRLLGTVSYFTD